MVDRGSLIAQALLALVFSYLLAVGATFNGVLNPEFQPLTHGMMALLLVIWLLVRWRRGWRWHRPPLDRIILLWGLSILLSWFANMDAWRRIAIGLWYIGLYVAVWLTLSDLLANRAFSRRVLVDALLISGVVVLYFGFLQLLPWLTQALQLGLSAVPPPRPVSVFGNPNFLGSYLTVLIPFVMVRLLAARGRLSRLVLLLYFLSTLLLLLLTFSRGAWIGAVLGVGLISALLLANRGLLSGGGLLGFWRRQPVIVRSVLAITPAALMILLALFLIVLLQSLSLSGRSAVLRTELYRASLLLLAEKPVTGQGLFTYGRELVRLPGIRPDQPHSHAHDLPLQVGAELGVVGLVVLVVTLAVVFRQLRAAWRAQSSAERVEYVGALGAITAFGIHHLTDLPAMMPAIALIGLLPLIYAVHVQPSRLMGMVTRRFYAGALIVLWGGLLALALWSSRVYTDYVMVLRQASATGDYRRAADDLGPVIDSDPSLSLYHAQQAFLYGLAAANGDVAATDLSIASYQRFLDLDPGYAFASANLSSLKESKRDMPAAIELLRKAVSLNVAAWQYRVGLARLLKDSGDTVAAGSELSVALDVFPDAFLLPEVASLAGDLGITVPPADLSLHAHVVQRLLRRDVSGAVSLWSDRVPLDPVPDRVISAILASSEADLIHAESLLAQATLLAGMQPVDRTWLAAGQSWLARQRADSATMERALNDVRALFRLVHAPFAADDSMLINIPYAQFLRLAIPRFHLPAVYYPTDSPLLMGLLNDLEPVR